MKVLIADDHEIVREGLTRLIDKQSDMAVVGYAENGLEALSKTKSLEPDIVIIDTGMPVLSGLDAVPLIHEAAPYTKIIIFSINKNDEYIHTSFHLGASGYVLKLSPCKDIIDSIRAADRGERYVSPVIKKRIIDMYNEKSDTPIKECLYDRLTNQEQQVFRLIVEGYSPIEIANQLTYCENRILSIIKSLSDKIQIHDLEAMVIYAEQIGVITPQCWNDLWCDSMPHNRNIM